MPEPLDQRLLRYDHLIIHCTATPPEIAGQVDARWVYRAHLLRGWRGNGYHFILPARGGIQSYDNGDACRPLDQRPAHVGDCGPGWNGRSIAVALVGGLDRHGAPSDTAYTDAQYLALRELIISLRAAHPLGSSLLTILGHRDLIRQTGAPPKACPCFDVGDWLEAVGLASEVDEDAPAPVADSPVKIPLEHVIQSGDTVWGLSRRYGVTMAEISRLNPVMPRPHKIIPGFRVRLR